MTVPGQTIINEARGCTLCASCLPLKPKPIFQLHPSARILIAGQAPGRKAHESGIPFNDASGTRLRSWMRIDETVFYSPETVAILPMGFCYPGTGTSGDLPPRPECVEHWRHQLLALLPHIQLTLLIGRYAQRWHLGNRAKSGLTATVQNWHDYWPQFAPLPHPSPRNNGWLKQNPWFEHELLPELQKRISELLSASD